MRRRIVPLAPAAPLASALLLWLSAPPVGLAWLAWVALVPATALLLARPQARAGRAAVPLAYVVFLELLLVPALPFGLAHNQWGKPLVPVLVGDSPVLVVAFALVPLAGAVLYALRFPLVIPLARPTTPAAAFAVVAIAATAWTALDLLRTKFDPGGFWGPLYLSQAGLPTARAAGLAGPWLLTFLIVAVNAAVALALVGPRRRIALAPGAAAAALALAAMLAVDPSAGAGPPARVAAIQPGYDTAEFERPVLHFLRRRFRDLERASLDLARDLTPATAQAAEQGATLVVWPEATLWVDPRANRRVAAALRLLTRETGVVLVAPYFLRGPDHGAAVVVLPNGRITRAQPKQRPMWFLGERGDNRVPPAPVLAGRTALGTALGVDTQDPAVARALARRGAALVASATHDWPALARQQLALTRLQAAALGIPFVRADWRYGSAIVAPGGALAAAAGWAKRPAVLVADVPAAGSATPYTRLGDALGWIAVALTASVAAVGRLRRLHRERAEAEGAPDALAEPERASHARP
ncbi:MAG: hypothetical protein ICV74_00120 [Thermoleophilia bacterium]|nr:hypothetical protein [Thermoleophilia bacterium]